MNSQNVASRQTDDLPTPIESRVHYRVFVVRRDKSTTPAACSSYGHVVTTLYQKLIEICAV